MGKKIVYKAANMFEPDETKYGCRLVLVKDATAIVVLEVDDDDILSDISKRRAYISTSVDPGEDYNYENIFPEKILSIDELEKAAESTLPLTGYLHSVKCRATKARVIDILDGRTGFPIGYDVRVFSIYDGSFEYMIGKVAHGVRYDVKHASADYLHKLRTPIICGPGIHYFERVYEAYWYGNGGIKDYDVIERLIKYAERKNMGYRCEDNA